MPQVRGLHFNGSLPFAKSEDAIRFQSQVAGSKAKQPTRYSDGEPGVRGGFIIWQIGKFAEIHPALLCDQFRAMMDPDSTGEYSDLDRREALRLLATHSIETGYDTAALEGYATFRRLKTEGIVELGARFLVGLPTPLSGASLPLDDRLVADAEPLYDEALLRALDRIQEGIPSGELAIQWDMPIEFMFLENADFAGRKVEPWWDPLFEGVIDRLVRLAGHVNEGVEMGFHFCYGDADQITAYNASKGRSSRHFVDPKDVSLMVKVVDELLRKAPRRVDWVTMPVPKDRTDDAYFSPLKTIDWDAVGTSLVLGLVHVDDLEGTRARMEAAGSAVPAFHIASPCGLGRCPREKIEALGELYAAVV